MQKSVPPLVSYGACYFAVVVRAKRSFAPMRQPFPSSCLLLSPLWGKGRGDGRDESGRLRARSHPSILLFPPFPRRRAAWGGRPISGKKLLHSYSDVVFDTGCVQSRLTKPRLRLSLRGAVFATKQSPIAVWRLLRCAARNDRGADFAHALVFDKPALSR